MFNTGENFVLDTRADVIRAPEIRIEEKSDVVLTTQSGIAPTGLPDYPNTSTSYVFNVGRGVNVVTVTLNPARMTEQSRVRRLNEAMKDSR